MKKGAKRAVMRPHFRSRVERNKKKPKRDDAWVFWFDDLEEVEERLNNKGAEDKPAPDNNTA